MKYYNPQTLLSKTDITGKKPEIYICDGSRSCGKTTAFNRLIFNRFLKTGKKFILLYRFSYEIADAAEKFFPTIQSLYFQNYSVSQKLKARGKYAELYCSGNGYENESCGYAIAINSADFIKKYSQKFIDTDCILFDEFQSESNNYCNNEIKKFTSIHVSIARAPYCPVRYVPVYMLSNSVSLLNPYYIALGIVDRLQDNTRFLRGDGWIMERVGNEEISKNQIESPFLRAFSNTDYNNFLSGDSYLLDNTTFIEKMNIEQSKYLCNLQSNGKQYALRILKNEIVYVSSKVDYECKIKISSNYEDLNEEYIGKNTYDGLLLFLKNYFDRGKIRFENIECKNAIIKLLSHDTYK